MADDSGYVFWCEPCGKEHDLRTFRMEYEYVDSPLPDGGTLRTPRLTAESREAYRHWELADAIPGALGGESTDG